MAALAWGVQLARREAGRARVHLTLVAATAPGSMPVAHVGGVARAVLRLRWRGPLAFLDLDNDGRAERLVFGPGTLDAAARRELRLFMPRTVPSGARPSMAP